MVEPPDLLARRRTHFVLWNPAHSDPAPRLVIGRYQPGNPPVLSSEQQLDLVLEAGTGELWLRAARDCGLDEGRVYHYWFEVLDADPRVKAPRVIRCTDPFATTVDWRLLAPALPAPYGHDDRDPAGVVKFRDGSLVACDPDGEEPDWSEDPAPDGLAPNHRTVIYKLPTRWARLGRESGVEVAVGTFRDVRALVDPATPPSNFRGVPALDDGAHLRELGANLLELAPIADSWVGREWGYATSNYLAPDHDLGFPAGNSSPTAGSDLARLVVACHRAGIRFGYDAVMAFATRAPYANINYLDFHVLNGSGDPEQDDRQDFGGNLLKYGYRSAGYDPLTGAATDRVPARQWMKVHLAHWIDAHHIDAIRVDSVNNVFNMEFVRECRELARERFVERFREATGTTQGADERFLVSGEELSVPVELVHQKRVDALGNERFKHLVRHAILGESAPGLTFEATVRRMIDCRELGFADGAQAVNYVTSHDVEGMRNERLYNLLANNGVHQAEQRIKLAFACLLTAVGIPMILAGEEFADEHDLAVRHPAKQVDPVNYSRLADPWRQRIFACVARLVRLRVASDALAVNDTEMIHADFDDGKRVLAWRRGRRRDDAVVVVANFSDWATANPTDPAAEYVVPGWPSTPAGRRWHEVTQDRDVPLEWAGREPLYPWEAKVYTLI
jgi:1,4-alpha-glucan branching enzyme